jgi:hypothetical protein
MSQPKKRKHAHHTNTPKIERGIVYYRLVTFAVIIFTLFGSGIAFFAAGVNIAWLIFGGAIGALSGFLFGYQVVRGFSKKNKRT